MALDQTPLVESRRVLDILREKIRIHGYQPHEVVQALGWAPDRLTEATAHNLTYADITLVCELLGEQVATLWVALGWVTEDQAAENLRPVTVAPEDYLTALLADCDTGLIYPHPARLGYGSVRGKLKASAVARHDYLTRLLAWLECTRELEIRAAARQSAIKRQQPWPRYGSLNWPVFLKTGSPGHGLQTLNLLLSSELVARLEEARDRRTVRGMPATSSHIVAKALESFLTRDERKADRNGARRKRRDS